MKKWFAAVMAVILVLSLVGCGSDQKATGSASGEEKTLESTGADQMNNESEKETPENDGSEAGTSSEAGSEADASSDAGTTDNDQAAVSADKFIYRTEDEMKSFMQNYEPSEGFEYGDAVWSMSSETVTFSGTLMPDEEHFVSLNVRAQNNAGDDKIPLILADAYREICDKTGLSFDGAEEAIGQIISLDDPGAFSAEGYNLSVANPGKNYHFSLVRKYKEYEALPYTVEDAEAYMKHNGGETGKISRSVTVLTKSENPGFSWEGALDREGHLNNVSAFYYGEDAAEGKAFLNAFVEYFLTDDVREGALNLITEKYDTLEKNKAPEHANADQYRVQLRRRSKYYELTINVSAMTASADAALFPGREEMAKLQQDPFTRRGIDTELKMPETTLFDKEGIKVACERSLYSANGPGVVLLFRVEELPDNAFLEIDLKAINGVSTEPLEEIIANTDDFSNIDFEARAGEVSPEDKQNITLSLAALDHITDFTGLTSLTFEGYCILNHETQIPLEEITIECVH
ncbi:MAG: hypothetical protein IJL98_09570 [Lachnospiraceae bacterium]|nr:hypothetical protein [Lachnospiraceae bacterium]